MRIAILAWGSLVWDRRELALVADFQPNGPALPIAFSRVSGDGRLTLVIDEANGNPCGTWTAISRFEDLEKAIENLRLRENMPTAAAVGFVDRRTGKRADAAVQRHPRALQTIAAWATASGHDAVIWTALGTNFREKTRRAFSVPAALDYLAALDAPTRATALAYIRKAPPQVRSLLRREVDARWPSESH